MTTDKTFSIYRGSILIQSALLPSALYGLSFAALAVTFLCWLKIGDHKNAKKLLRKPQILCPVLLYFIVLIGFFFSMDFKEALSSLSEKLPFLLFPIIIGTSSVINDKIIAASSRWFIWATVISLLIALVYAVTDVYKTGAINVQIGDNIANKFMSHGFTRVFSNWHPTNVSLFTNLSIAIIFHNFFLERMTFKKITGYILLLLFLSCCVFLLNSIMGIIIYFSLLIYGGVLLMKRLDISGVYKAFIFSFVFIAGVVFFYTNPLHSDKLESFYQKDVKLTDNQSERNFLTIRLAKWDAYTEIIKEHLLLGTTEGNIKILRKQAYLRKGYLDLAKYNYNAHNQYLEALATYGIIGLLLLASLFFLPIIQKSYCPLYLPFLIISCTIFISESLLNRQQGILFFMFYYSAFTHVSFKR